MDKSGNINIYYGASDEYTAGAVTTVAEVMETLE
jgi:predicted GH43/DUF377 family glycosyl hydrolase